MKIIELGTIISLFISVIFGIFSYIDWWQYHAFFESFDPYWQFNNYFMIVGFEIAVIIISILGVCLIIDHINKEYY